MAIEIVSFPIKNCDFPWLCKRLPEGIQHHIHLDSRHLALLAKKTKADGDGESMVNPMINQLI